MQRIERNLVENKLTNKNLNRRLKFAIEARQYEIDSLWTRTTYHSVIVGALFLARYNISFSSDYFIMIVLDILLILVCFIWYLSGRGSKFWQEAWENEVAQILYAIEGREVAKIIQEADFKTTKEEILEKYKKIEKSLQWIENINSANSPEELNKKLDKKEKESYRLDLPFLYIFPATLKNKGSPLKAPLNAYRFSPSKLNIIVSLIAFIGAYLLFGYDVFWELESIPKFFSFFAESNRSYIFSCSKLALLILPITLIWMIYLFSVPKKNNT